MTARKQGVKGQKQTFSENFEGGVNSQKPAQKAGDFALEDGTVTSHTLVLTFL